MENLATRMHHERAYSATSLQQANRPYTRDYGRGGPEKKCDSNLEITFLSKSKTLTSIHVFRSENNALLMLHKMSWDS